MVTIFGHVWNNVDTNSLNNYGSGKLSFFNPG